METIREIAQRTYKAQIEIGLPNTPMNWHLWKKAFDIASIELSKLHQPTVSGAVCLHEKQYQCYNSKTKLQICDKCGEITN
jgi:hypothetical protein